MPRESKFVKDAAFLTAVKSDRGADEKPAAVGVLFLLASSALHEYRDALQAAFCTEVLYQQSVGCALQAWDANGAMP